MNLAGSGQYEDGHTDGLDRGVARFISRNPRINSVQRQVLGQDFPGLLGHNGVHLLLLCFDKLKKIPNQTGRDQCPIIATGQGGLIIVSRGAEAMECILESGLGDVCCPSSVVT